MKKLGFVWIVSIVVSLGFMSNDLAGQVGGLGDAPAADETKVMTATPETEFIEVAIGDAFHKNVIKAGVKLRKDGKITRGQMLTLRIAMLSPSFRAKAKELAVIQMNCSDDADKIPRIGENIDWEKLFEFIEKLIPLILQLIEIISGFTSYDIPTDTFDVSGII